MGDTTWLWPFSALGGRAEDGLFILYAYNAHMKYQPKIEYRYRMKPWLIGLVVLLLCILTPIFFQIAMVNDEGVILLKIIILDVQAATIFYYAFASLILLMAFIAIIRLTRSFGVDATVVLGQYAITAPKTPNGKKIITYNYTDITDIKIVIINHQTHLFIKKPKSHLIIQRAGFNSKQEFEEFVDELDSRI